MKRVVCSQCEYYNGAGHCLRDFSANDYGNDTDGNDAAYYSFKLKKSKTDEVTEQDWQKLYNKLFAEFKSLQDKKIFASGEWDRWTTLRLMVNAFNAGKRTSGLYLQMKQIIGEI